MKFSRCLNHLEVSVRDSVYVIVSAGTDGCLGDLESLSDDCERLGLSRLLWHVSGDDSCPMWRLKPRIMQDSLWHAGLPCVWINSADDLLEAPRLTDSQFKRVDIIVADNPDPKRDRKSSKFASFFGAVRSSKEGRRFLSQYRGFADSASKSGTNPQELDPMYSAYRLLLDERARLHRCVFLNASESFRGCVRLNPSASSSREVSFVS